jgi:hypothetical protein
MTKNKPVLHLVRDAVIVVLSIAFATWLYSSGALTLLLSATEGFGMLRILLVGLFFTSIFTTPLAVSAIIALGSMYDPFGIAFFGAFGAMVGDYIMFRFLKSSIADDLEYILKHAGLKRVVASIHTGHMRWFFTAIGALIIASPIPDEIGLALMGVSRMPNWLFLPMSYSMNALGILVFASIGAAIL